MSFIHSFIFIQHHHATDTSASSSFPLNLIHLSHRPIVSSSIGSSRRPSPFSTLHRSSSSLLLEPIWSLEAQIEQIVDPIILLLHFPSAISTLNRSSASFGSSLRFFKLIFCKDTP
ncbi:uncharacterized protein G2W53_006956 [Senna tora]|uniref:Uncharacterized protein n=1 Tax=Senna tora TaxID=362788 RepID=A0A834X639_9FABA|nr:uncharacterized protein G2W53_006956 [Senna tora]